MEEGYQADQTVSTPGCVCKWCRLHEEFIKTWAVSRSQQLCVFNL